MRRGTHKYDGVSLSHINDLIKYEQSMNLKLAPQLDTELITLGHFDKMNVGMALGLFSPAVVHGLEYLVKECGFSEDLSSTAKFIEVVAKMVLFGLFKTPQCCLEQIQ
jgi:hypothetical protein